MKIITTAIAMAMIAAAPLHAQTLTGQTASAAQAIAIAGGGGGGSPDGTIRQRLTTTPTVIPPGLQGANPCNIGGSGGGSFLGWGASAAYLGESRRCRGQEWFRFQMMAGNPAAAKAVACVTDEDMREAYRLIGDPCPQDRAQAAAAPAAPIAQPIAATAPAAAARPARPDWCGNLTGAAERARYAAECG